MRRFSMAAVFLLITIYTQSQGINFRRHTDWLAVLAKAKAEQKIIFLDAYATWCGPCKMMDRDVYFNKRIGQLMNDQFISVKLQVDKTDSDDAYTQSWYSEAAMLRTKYKLNSLPAMLFFSPDGEIIHSSFGYQPITTFEATIKFVTDPNADDFRWQLQAYKNGRKEYEKLPKLINYVRFNMLEDSLANFMARDYLQTIMNKQADKRNILNRQNMEFVLNNRPALKSSDKFIVELQKFPTTAEGDSVTCSPGSTVHLFDYIVRREELEMKLYKNGMVVNRRPDWKKIEKTITTKYPQINANQVISTFGVCLPTTGQGNGFYYRVEDWGRLNEYYQKDVSIKFAKNDYEGINDVGWFFYFCKVNDRSSLQLASRWMDSCLRLARLDKNIEATALARWIDTKAALVYKIGHRKAAIAIEQDAISLVQASNTSNGKPRDQGCSEFYKEIEKMQKGEKRNSGFSDLPVAYPRDWKLFD